MAVFRFIRNALIGGALAYGLTLLLEAIGHWLLAPGHAPSVPPGVGVAFNYLAYIIRMPSNALTLHHAAHWLQIGTLVTGYAFWGLIIAAMARAHEAKADLRRRREAIESRE